VPDPQPHHNPDGQQNARRTVRCGLLAFGAYNLLLGVLMFWPAGGLGWARGWAFLLTFFGLNVASVVYLWRTNPEIVVARSTPHRGTRWWDRVLFAVLNLLVLAIFPLAALDNARFHWSRVPLWVAVAGYVLFVFSMAGIAWVLRVNKFAEPRVRIQAERGQRVIDTGPYAIVRHPLYATSLFLCGGIPLLPQSFPT